MIVLDTHAWIWWVDNANQLSRPARDAIEAAALDHAIYISSISAWEVALLVRTGRLQLTMNVEDWIAHTEALPFVTFVPVNNRIAIKSVRLPIHSDPADRMIIATAMSLGATIATQDGKISAYVPVQTVW